MAKVNNFLSERLKMATEKLSKMTNLAEMSNSGNLSSFAGVFKVQKLTENEEDNLRHLLESFSEEEKEIDADLSQLCAITSEVKAISNQAAILHGERIKKAQEILKKYREGAFTSWLIGTYGNRQTPYNFLQYYELHMALPQLLHQQLNAMPRQVVYMLASREGDLKLKEEIVRNYQGQSKVELLSLIRKTFPLSYKDRRAQQLKGVTLSALRRIKASLVAAEYTPDSKEKKEIVKELKAFIHFIEGL